ncbi:MAG: biotin/lipoyl-containing protein, partial [Pseudomonadota bacterium]
MPVESVKVPDLGDSSDVEVIEILVKEGQSIEENEDIIVLETDKAAMEIPASRGGTVKSITVKVGDTVNQGDEILTVEAEGAGAVEEEEPGEQEDEKDAAGQEADDSDASGQPEEAAAEPSSSGGAVEQIDVPDIGDESDVEIIEVHVSEGDIISAEDPVITLESDKAAMEIPSPKGGEVKALKVKVGDRVSSGSPMMDLAVSGGDAPADRKEAPKKDDASASQKAEKPASAAASGNGDQKLEQKQQQYAEQAAGKAQGKVYAGPAVRKLARELGVDLTRIDGTGAKGRIQKEGV